MTLTQVKTFQPGQVRTTQITVLNTGNQTTVYALEITVGETGLFGFAAQRSPVLVLTPPISPGQQRQIPVPVQLPDAPGPKAFRIRIGEAGPTGQIIREFEEPSLFTGFAQVALPTMIPLPTEPPALPPAPTSQELALQFRDALGVPSITVSPTQVDQGETVSGTLSIPSAAAIPFTPRLTVTLIQFSAEIGAFEIRTIVQPRNVSLGAGDDITQSLSIDTTRLAPALYGLRVLLIDPTTGIVLVDQTFTNLFTINLPAAIAPPPAPAPTPTPTPTLALELVSVVVTPSTVRPLSTVAIDVTVRNTTLASGQLEFRAQVINDIGALPDIFGQLARRNNVPIGPNATITQSWTWTVPDDPADYPTGRQYGVFVAVLDESTQDELIVRSVRPLFTIEAPISDLLEEDLGPAAPAPAPTPRSSDLRITARYGPSVTRFGQQTTLTVEVTNIGDFNFGVEVDAKLMLPDTNFGQEIIPRTFGLLVVDQRRLFTGDLSTANLPSGSYGARVAVRSFASGRIIIVVNLPNLLVVISGGL